MDAVIIINRGGGAASAAGEKLRDELAAALAANGIGGEAEFVEGSDIADAPRTPSKSGCTLLWARRRQHQRRGGRPAGR